MFWYVLVCPKRILGKEDFRETGPWRETGHSGAREIMEWLLPGCEL